MNIFITGGLGFVGRHLSTALLEDGHHVTAVGRSSKPAGIRITSYNVCYTKLLREGKNET